jgi:ketosteroid isomerase-like protein
VGVGQNKAIAVSMLENMSNLRLDAAAEALSEDARWWVLGGGSFGKNGFRKGLRSMAAALPNGLRLKISRVIAEGDYVIVEAEGNAPASNGKTYNNHYVWIMTIRGGKIVEGREYIDTLHLIETFGPIFRPKTIL